MSLDRGERALAHLALLCVLLKDLGFHKRVPREGLEGAANAQ